MNVLDEVSQKEVGTKLAELCKIRTFIFSVKPTSSGNILRFPRAADEPPQARGALRGLIKAFPPAGVSVYFRSW